MAQGSKVCLCKFAETRSPKIVHFHRSICQRHQEETMWRSFLEQVSTFHARHVEFEMYRFHPCKSRGSTNAFLDVDGKNTDHSRKPLVDQLARPTDLHV